MYGEFLAADWKNWRSVHLRDEKGIIVASDRTQEWLLPWWWSHYSRWNSLPVSFVDLGLSPPKKKWCRQRGELISLSLEELKISGREEIEPSLILDWELQCGASFWDKRKAFYKKPFACLQSPFRKSLWVDLDCEIRGSIEEMFNYIQHAPGFSLSLDQVVSGPGFRVYNSGVLLFQHGVPLLKQWADQSLTKNQYFLSDQHLLSHLITENESAVNHLPWIYHWSHSCEENALAVIVHWHGARGKKAIRQQIQLLRGTWNRFRA
jgi:hypothetical protein